MKKTSCPLCGNNFSEKYFKKLSYIQQSIVIHMLKMLDKESVRLKKLLLGK